MSKDLGNIALVHNTKEKWQQIYSDFPPIQ